MTDIITTDGHIDIEATMAILKAKRFREWNLTELVHCPQPKMYQAAREELAQRMFPFFIDLLKEMGKYDIRIDKDRVEFFIKTMDIEMVKLIAASPMDDKMQQVIVAYIAVAKDLRHQIFDNDVVGHDIMAGVAAAIKLQQDLMDLMGVEMVPLKEGDPHPLSHRVPKLPGVT